MDPDQGRRLLEAVKAMRRLQIQFFSGKRTANTVGEAKDAERRVDAIVKEIEGGEKPALF